MYKRRTAAPSLSDALKNRAGGSSLSGQMTVCLKWHGWRTVTPAPPSLPVCLSQIPFNVLRSPFRPNQIESKKLSSVEGWKTGVKGGEKSWIFHQNCFIKVLLHWNFATREALTAVSRQIPTRATKTHSLTWNLWITNIFIHHRPAGDCFKLKLNGFLQYEYITAQQYFSDTSDATTQHNTVICKQSDLSNVGHQTTGCLQAYQAW